MIVKICGLTNANDALLAQRLGASIAGFIFAPSPRRMDPGRAGAIIKRLKAGVLKAGVFVNEDLGTVNFIIKKLKLNIAQLSGDESPGYLSGVKNAVIFKVIRVKTLAGLKKQVKLYEKSADAFLFDTYKKGSYGGTGKPFDWKLLKKAAIKKPYFLAGGLGPDNVCAAIKEGNPYGVDVSSGVEKSPGKKSRAKMMKFFREIDRLQKSKVKKQNK
jgi:phosphoribosylanthranilate isomerase